MKQVRIGRKEQSMLQARHDRQVYAQFLKSSGRKTDPDALINGMLASGHDIMALVNDMHAASYSADVAEGDFDRLLFAASTTDIRQLPPAILDAKEALVPADLIPTGMDDLKRFLERLMVATGRETNIDVLVAGWSVGQSPGRNFNGHVEQLWQLGRKEPALYTALVGGRFGPVIRYVQQGHATSVVSRRLRNLLVGQALIWCAHDVQLAIARLTKTPEYKYLLPNSRSPEGALNHLRDRRVALDTTLDLFFGSSDWRHGDVEPVWSGTNVPITSHPNPIVRRAAKSIARRGSKLDSQLREADVAVMVQQIVVKLRKDAFLARVAAPRTANIEAKSYASDWYGLPPLAAASVAIRRLIQAEQQLPAMIDAVIDGVTSPAMSILLPLPAYDEADTHHSSADRLNHLLAFYREAILADDNDSSSRPWKATGAAREFLVAQGTRRSDDHHGTAGDLRRAFYLLDVIPEHRFTIG